MIKKHIGIYSYSDALFKEYDIDNPVVFNKLKKVILHAVPFVLIEHVGSTSVINCGGKGIIDIAILYKNGQLELTKNGLESLGFQKQVSTDPFPESRPMRVGSIKLKNKNYKIHAHVIKFGCREHFELVYLRELLNMNATLRKNYEQMKKKIIEKGITNSLEYCIEKGKFIRSQILKPLSRIKSLNHDNMRFPDEALRVW
jgi:GrpB-like predicted nucleotidyltransferase (UPF0157 family)